ncbi:tripartite tricarboxylate transporter TctB family protein [Paracoccus pantotrophus]|uniref:Tripartite tricarboxylate transporter TctB family protein n=1 Tax=Paracoccus pantotrophus TaxID=82367 RepID=A0A7H9BT39_PARPN|nr:tripartite tricarboxylate transporter TctB family protein [Paracoccus pantotrophus]QLH13021.1 tripartite tricarboxylate transporter TctB family protein [Paracoccus pantotrophus]
MHTNINARDSLAGIILLILAAFGLYLNSSNPVGTAGRMGPGYMPMVVFICLAVLGAGVLAVGLRGEPQRLARIAWRELGLIVVALVLFGALLQDFGMAASTVTLVVISGLADREQTLRGIAVLAAFLLFLCWLIFVWGLKINVSFLPPALSGL